MIRKPLFLLALLLGVGAVLAVFARPLPAGSFDATLHERWVVRATFDDRDMIVELAEWTEPWHVDYQQNVVVLDVDKAGWDWLEAVGFTVEVDPRLTAEMHQPRTALPNQGGGIPGYECYRTVEETFQTAIDLTAIYPDFATWIDVGDSWDKETPGGPDGYDMMVLKLTNSNIPGPKPVFFATGAIHAREYTTAELATRFAEYLLHNYGVDADATWLLDYHEIHLMLHTNPDGRKIAETGIQWRKNRNNTDGCFSNFGVDLNRNFEFYWNSGGSDSNPCGETYRGSSAGSEPEVQAVQNYAMAIFPDQREDPLPAPAPEDAMGVYVDLHSFSELVLWPWGFTGTPTGNDQAFETFGRKLAWFNDYMPQQAIELYPTSGTTDDYLYGELGVAAFTFELGTSFFQSCGVFESTIYPDNLPALVYMAKAARTPYLSPAGPDALDLTLDSAAVAPGTPVELTASLNDTRFSSNNGVEPVQDIAAGEYYIDTPPWDGGTPLPMTAGDGNFNDPVETAEATIDTTGLTTGRHIIYVRGQDTDDNWGVVSAVFLYVVDPAVAPTLEGYVRDATTNDPLAATIKIGGQFQATTEPATGFYQTHVISGTYDVTASAPGYGSQTVSNVTLEDMQTVQQDFGLLPICPVFSDDVENGNIGWTAQAPWAITTESSHSPTHSWTDSPGGNYGNNVNTSLTSPALDLSDYSSVQINFWHICDTEAGYDFCHVEVSTNGSNWTTVASFDGSHFQWEEVTVDAPQLDNASTGYIRFRLQTDIFVMDDGWHVDDITVLGASASCGGEVAPTASFTSNSPVQLGDPVEFTNTSTGGGLSYEWDFGDGSPISVEKDPAHVYAAAGTYTVTLTATNSMGSDVFSDQVEVTAGVPPTASFTSNSPVQLGDPVEFTNTSTGTDLSFEWDFGDGSPVSTEENPSHLYGAVGTYTVTLTATNSLGSDSFSDMVEVTAVEIPPTASFTSNSPVPVGDAMQFTNTSTGTNLTFEWDFGDGSPVSTDVNPSHVYTMTGSYTVTLTATNSLGSDVFSDTVEVTAEIAPTALFTASATLVKTGELVVFTNGSTGGNLTFEWDFGDGNTSTEVNPVHVFAAPGTYVVTLTATNSVGSDSYALEIMVMDYVSFLPVMKNE